MTTNTDINFGYGMADVFLGDNGQTNTSYPIPSITPDPVLASYDPYADDATNQVTTDTVSNKDPSLGELGINTDLPPGGTNVGSGGVGGQTTSGVTWGNLPSLLLDKLKNITPAQAAALTAGIGSLAAGWNKPTNAAYQGKVPTYTATRSILPGVFNAASTPQTYGSAHMGKRYFTPVKYAASGGIMANAPRYLRGGTDGMADKLSTTIDNNQPAKLSHGEFVIPADVVSHLGNGNSDAGANELYKMMDRVRKARTGNPKQGRQINPEKFTNFAGGGVVAFNGGGLSFNESSEVPGTLHFSGNTDGSAVPTTPSTSTAPSTTNPNLSPTSSVSTSSGLSPWVGDYVTNMLGQGQALANQDYQAYEGPLTAGSSPLQQQSWNQLSGWQAPTAFNTASGILQGTSNQLGPIGSVQDYMSPYVQNVLDRQMAEARRQSDISGQSDQAKMAQAGAFGGSRDALMRSERDRNLQTNLSGIESTGLNTAWNNAQNQRNTAAQIQQGLGSALGSIGSQQSQSELAGIGALANAGETQRNIEQQGITADINQFNNERDWPYKQLQFQQSLLSGLPTGTQTQSVGTTPYDQFGSAVTTATDLYNKIKAIIGG